MSQYNKIVKRENKWIEEDVCIFFNPDVFGWDNGEVYRTREDNVYVMSLTTCKVYEFKQSSAALKEKTYEPLPGEAVITTLNNKAFAKTLQVFSNNTFEINVYINTSVTVDNCFENNILPIKNRSIECNYSIDKEVMIYIPKMAGDTYRIGWRHGVICSMERNCICVVVEENNKFFKVALSKNQLFRIVDPSQFQELYMLQTVEHNGKYVVIDMDEKNVKLSSGKWVEKSDIKCPTFNHKDYEKTFIDKTEIEAKYID